jgi:signal transduction histidine kinase
MKRGRAPLRHHPGMQGTALTRRLPIVLLATASMVLGAALIVRWDIAQRREAFQADARAAHRLLSQRMAQHEAILATLALAEPPADGVGATSARSLPLPPGFAQLLRATAQAPPAGAAAGSAGTAPSIVVRTTDAAGARYVLSSSSARGSHDLLIDARRLLQDEDWPFVRDGAEQVVLGVGGKDWVLQAGAPAVSRPAGLTEGFRFAQRLASDSQPFELRVQRRTGPADWPWPLLAAWVLFSGLALWLLLRWRGVREERRRAAELLRLAQVARLDTMGELAAGMAHELNQPLTAMLSGTQAALRVLHEAREDGSPPSDEQAAARACEAAIPALELAAAQARRAADVVTRLRTLVQRPSVAARAVPVDLAALARKLAGLLEPELARRGIEWRLEGQAGPAMGDRVAIEQILHNLLSNALQALEQAAPSGRRIVVTLAQGPHDPKAAGQVSCAVRDNGPGVSAEVRAHVFEPFFSTRAGGLGLGLSLSQTLAQSMGGRLEFGEAVPQGAVFTLILPATDLHSQRFTS